MSKSDHYWEISGPRKYLNIPTQVPDHWRAELTFGQFTNSQTVIGWGPTEEAAKADAVRRRDEACRPQIGR